LKDAVVNGPAKWYDLLGRLHLDAEGRNKGLTAAREATATSTPRVGSQLPTAWNSFDIGRRSSGIPITGRDSAVAVDHDGGNGSGSGKKSFAVKMIFADSLAELTDLVDKVLDPVHWLSAEIVGVRFAAAGLVESRFGLRTDCPKVLAAAAREMARLPEGVKLGVHFHFASSTVGLGRWSHLAGAFVGCVRNFEALIGRHIRLLDFGGGWPSRLIEDPRAGPVLEAVFRLAKQQLNGLETVVMEPGKCVSEHAGALVMRVHSVRETVDTRMAIVDGSVAEAAALVAHPHPVFALRDGTWTALKTGNDAIGGRTCIEWDFMHTNISLPEDIREGDYILVAFTGAYDTTISYVSVTAPPAVSPWYSTLGWV